MDGNRDRRRRCREHCKKSWSLSVTIRPSPELPALTQQSSESSSSSSAGDSNVKDLATRIVQPLNGDCRTSAKSKGSGSGCPALSAFRHCCVHSSKSSQLGCRIHGFSVGVQSSFALFQFKDRALIGKESFSASNVTNMDSKDGSGLICCVPSESEDDEWERLDRFLSLRPVSQKNSLPGKSGVSGTLVFISTSLRRFVVCRIPTRKPVCPDSSVR
mmetsp:Transcript_134943/g.259374  ORF Transcript_134943/g.259374 Transcript_134943/m.259374 type:complete len:216 (-) Transcript_134943:166-813(-)